MQQGVQAAATPEVTSQQDTTQPRHPVKMAVETANGFSMKKLANVCVANTTDKQVIIIC